MSRIGMLTPSSNTVLEPMTSRMISSVPGSSVHFSRFAVTEIALDEAALAQFDTAPMLEAAKLLAHGNMDVIGWNGTSASWLGLESDRALVREITEHTGIAASTCVLSLMDAIDALGIRRYGLVTPYTKNVQDKIINNFADYNLICGAEIHFGIRDNFSFGTVPSAQVANAVRSVASQDVEAVVVLCTNLPGADTAAEIETETGVPVLDSVTLTVWGALRAAGIPTADLALWGPRLSQL